MSSAKSSLPKYAVSLRGQAWCVASLLKRHATTSLLLDAFQVVNPDNVPSTVSKERPTGKKATFYCVRFFPAGD